jgi:hypothetical protein
MFGKRGQITIFIIIAVVLVASVALFFVLRKPVLKVGVSEDVDINGFLTTCLGDKIREGTDLISLQGGNVEPKISKRFKFDDEPYRNISYLCYTGGYYLPCTNIEPLLLSHIKEELKEYIFQEVESCFNDAADSLENKGYIVDSNYRGFNIEFSLTKIIVKIDGDMTITKAEETKKLEGLNVAVISRFYDLAMVTQEILNQEGRFCYFNSQGYMIFYPEYEIDRFHTSDATTIYTVGYKDSEEKFRFAIRGCVFPPGW